jgi:predicted lipid-binding transport protein (Tim44 family)
MNESFQFIDIIFFAMVAFFLVMRLRSVLGKRTGNERPPQLDGLKRSGEPSGNGDNVIELPDRRRTIPEGPQDPYTGTAIGAGLTQIRLADPTFETQRFLQGAKAAFEIILGAFAAGDVKTLKPLLNADVLRNFQGAIEARQKAGESLDSELIGIKSVELVEAGVEGRHAVITVKLVSEQVNALRAANGEVLDGDPNRVTEVVDIWTFSRDSRSRDPNWLLVATATPDE